MKYRKKVFTNDAMVDFLKMNTGEVAYTFYVDIPEIECGKYHFNMLFKYTPLLNIPQFINAVKTITSRDIQRKFPEAKKEPYNGKLWSPSYFLATSGQVTLDVLKRYVDLQEVKRHENV